MIFACLRVKNMFVKLFHFINKYTHTQPENVQLAYKLNIPQIRAGYHIFDGTETLHVGKVE